MQKPLAIALAVLLLVLAGLMFFVKPPAFPMGLTPPKVTAIALVLLAAFHGATALLPARPRA